jgi:hypothetical protein
MPLSDEHIVSNNADTQALAVAEPASQPYDRRANQIYVRVAFHTILPPTLPSCLDFIARKLLLILSALPCNIFLPYSGDTGRGINPSWGQCSVNGICDYGKPKT